MILTALILLAAVEITGRAVSDWWTEGQTEWSFIGALLRFLGLGSQQVHGSLEINPYWIYLGAAAVAFFVFLASRDE